MKVLVAVRYDEGIDYWEVDEGIEYWEVD